MPYPRAGQSKNDYISEFMRSAEAQRDYPKEDQRVAVAENLWRERGNVSDLCPECGAMAGVDPDGIYRQCAACGYQGLIEQTGDVSKLPDMCPTAGCLHSLDTQHSEFGCDVEGCACARQREVLQPRDVFNAEDFMVSLDGMAPVKVSDLLRTNPDLDPEDRRMILALQPGKSCILGGGAAAEFRIERLNAGFEEGKHPRADDGKFGSGGGKSDKPAPDAFEKHQAKIMAEMDEREKDPNEDPRNLPPKKGPQKPWPPERKNASDAHTCESMTCASRRVPAAFKVTYSGGNVGYLCKDHEKVLERKKAAGEVSAIERVNASENANAIVDIRAGHWNTMSVDNRRRLLAELGQTADPNLRFSQLPRAVQGYLLDSAMDTKHYGLENAGEGKCACGDPKRSQESPDYHTPNSDRCKQIQEQASIENANAAESFDAHAGACEGCRNALESTKPELMCDEGGRILNGENHNATSKCDFCGRQVDLGEMFKIKDPRYPDGKLICDTCMAAEKGMRENANASPLNVGDPHHTISDAVSIADAASAGAEAFGSPR